MVVGEEEAVEETDGVVESEEDTERVDERVCLAERDEVDVAVGLANPEFVPALDTDADAVEVEAGDSEGIDDGDEVPEFDTDTDAELDG